METRFPQASQSVPELNSPTTLELCLLPEHKDYKHELPLPAYVFFLLPEPLSIFDSSPSSFHDFLQARLLRWFHEYQQWLLLFNSSSHLRVLCSTGRSPLLLLSCFSSLALLYLRSLLWFHVIWTAPLRADPLSLYTYDFLQAHDLKRFYTFPR